MLNIIKNFFNTYKYWLVIISLTSIFAIVNFNKSNRLEKQLAVASQNLDAAKDTLRITKDRNGRIEYDKLSFMTSRLNDLEKLNSDLYAEVKATKGKVNTIIKIGAGIVHDTVPLQVQTNSKDGVVISNFQFDTSYSPGNYRKISGFTSYNLQTDKSLGKLTTDQIAFTATTGIRELNGKKEIFFRPDYPGLTVSRLDGAEIDPNLFKKNKGPLVNVSISAGYLPLIYDLKTGKTEVFGSKIGVNAGLSVNVNRLFKK